VKVDDYAVVFSGGGALGAWEVGAYDAIISRHLGHPPTIVTGASAGALNAAAVCAGMSVVDLQKLWENLSPKAVFRSHVGARDAVWYVARHGSLSKGIRALLSKKRSIFRTEPLITQIEAEFGQSGHGRFRHFTESQMSCVVALTDLRNRRRIFFVKQGLQHPKVSCPDDGCWQEINAAETLHEALIGSTAIPVLFPPSPGDYFDGGILLNQPIQPALFLGAKTIYVLIPNSNPQGDIRNLISIGTTLLSTWMASSFDADIERIKGINLRASLSGSDDRIKLCVVRPGQSLEKTFPGLGMLDFGREVSDLVQNGRDAANHRLNNFRHNDPSSWDSNPEDATRRTIMQIPPDEHRPKVTIPDSEIEVTEVTEVTIVHRKFLQKPR